MDEYKDLQFDTRLSAKARMIDIREQLIAIEHSIPHSTGPNVGNYQSAIWTRDSMDNVHQMD